MAGSRPRSGACAARLAGRRSQRRAFRLWRALRVWGSAARKAHLEHRVLAGLGLRPAFGEMVAIDEGHGQETHMRRLWVMQVGRSDQKEFEAARSSLQRAGF